MNPLAETFGWYNIARDNHKVVVRILDKDPSLLPLSVSYASEPVFLVKEQLLKALQELEDLAIVSLTFIFEQIILNHIIKTAEQIKTQEADAFGRAVVEYSLKSPERWHFEEVLDLYKAIAPADLFGQVKQIYKYRNWVAHGKKGPRPMSIDPKTAYQRFIGFLKQAQLINEF